MKNVETADKIHLGSLIEELKSGRYVIPDFQREFEWKPWDVRDLIKSIFMDYYIGTLLLWKGSVENFDILSCESIYGYEGDGKPEHIVLDGQQRLTAIHYAFFDVKKEFPGRKSRFLFFVQIDELMDENYDEAFFYTPETKKISTILEDEIRQFDSNLFPLVLMGKGVWGITGWIERYKKYWEDKLEEISKQSEVNENAGYESGMLKVKYQKFASYSKEFENVLRELFDQYYISYIELDREIYIAKVCDIFTQINSKGIPLNIFDLLNAILRPFDIYLKDLWRECSVDLEYTDASKMKIYILQVMSVLLQTYCSPKYLYYLVPGAKKSIKTSDGSKEVILLETKEFFLEKWDEAVSAIKKTVMLMKNPREFGAISSSFVPYPSIIPALASIKCYVEKGNFKNLVDINIKIKKWYWASIFTQSYSSAVESTTAKDFTDLKEWFVDDQNIPERIEEFIHEFRSLDLLKETKKGSAIYNAIFNILILNGARDWATLDLPEYETLDDHHIVPHSWGKDKIGEEINSILNKTPLSPDTNRKVINKKLPNEYIKKMLANNEEEAVYQVLKTHLISKTAIDILLRDGFTKDDYYEFIDERRRTIINAIEYLIVKNKMELPTNLKEVDEEIEKVELKIRDFIAYKFDAEEDVYSNRTPSHIQDKVNRRIGAILKKSMTLNSHDLAEFRKRLDYFDLQEYCDFIVAKNNWSAFENDFNNKAQLMNKFAQLGDLRNSLRHSRDVSEIVLMEGKAAILWFNSALKNQTAE